MRVWLTVAILAFNLYTFFDCARTDQGAIRKGPKWAWLLSIFIFETFGAISWYIWGRPKSAGSGRGKRKIIPPDDDPDFLRKI
jgi:hypothetical protein